MRYNLTTKKSWNDTIEDLAATFRKWGVTDWETRPQRPPKTARQYQSVDERRVALRFVRKGQGVELACASQDTAQDNLRVLYLVIEALRLNDVRGYGALYADAARQLYPALPAPGQQSPSVHTPYAVLHVRDTAPLVVCEAAYKALARQAHPDSGGSDDRMQALNAAIAAIRQRD